MKQPTVVIPLRAGKSRLVGALPGDAIAALRTAMFADVVAALRGAHVEHILVAAGDELSAEVARNQRLPFHRDPESCDGLDEAIQAAAMAANPSVVDLLVIQADLPALTANDVRALLYAPGDVVIAPTSDGGTGALLRRPVGAMSTSYGPESAALHAARAVDAGSTPTILRLPGFRLDVDTDHDLTALPGTSNLGRHTARWLGTHGHRGQTGHAQQADQADALPSG